MDWLFNECSARTNLLRRSQSSKKARTGKRPILILSIDDIKALPLVVTAIVGSKGENIRQNYPTNVRVTP
jgi:mRNA-degrading endonuclease toxin of MazEF toxin-antitoxin module